MRSGDKRKSYLVRSVFRSYWTKEKIERYRQMALERSTPEGFVKKNSIKYFKYKIIKSIKGLIND